jgi:hypothetical protein
MGQILTVFLTTNGMAGRFPRVDIGPEIPKVGTRTRRVGRVTIGGDITAGEGLRSSKYHIIISSTVRPANSTIRLRMEREMQRIVNDLLSNNDSLAPVVGIHQNDKFTDVDGSWDNATFPVINSITRAETGPHRQGGRVHTHSLLEFSHNSFIKLNGDEISAYVKERMVRLFPAEMANVTGRVFVKIKSINLAWLRAVNYVFSSGDPDINAISEQFTELDLG